MRLLSRKLYRAFPELDRFTDQECEWWIAHVRSAEVGSGWVIALGILAAAGVTFSAVCKLLYLLESGTLGAWVARVPKDVALVVTVAGVLGLPVLAALLVRDLLVRYYLLRDLREGLARVRCPACEYLLLGQRAPGGVVTCPECGARTSLEELEIAEADLIPPADPAEVER